MKTPSQITLYGIPNCDTVKKARAWLKDQGVAHSFVDFKKTGVPSELDDWERALGWEKLLNRAGSTYKNLSEAEKAAVRDAASAKALMRAQPSCIKRPVVCWGEQDFSLGFSVDFYRGKLATAQRIY
jgi:Spx/MgsR family transcriptional regulator